MSDWVLNKLQGQSSVLQTELITQSVIHIKAELISGKVGCFTDASIAYKQAVVAIEEWNCDYILHVKKNSVISGSCLSYCSNNGVGIGSLGCMYRAINRGDFTNNHDPESEFIIRGLEQHSKVTSIVLKSNRMYEINRIGLGPIRVLAINDYDITADSVRSHVDGHGRCDLILSSNPNAGGSSEADSAAEQLNTKIVKWAELLGKINYVKSKCH